MVTFGATFGKFWATFYFLHLVTLDLSAQSENSFLQ